MKYICRYNNLFQEMANSGKPIKQKMEGYLYLMEKSKSTH